MNYLQKTIETHSGENASVWKGMNFTADLRTGKGSVSLAGYFSVDAMQAGAATLGHESCPVESIEALTNYENFFTEVFTKLVGDPENVFAGATIIPCPVDQHGRNLSKPIVVETGATASCWRCVNMDANLRKGSVTFTFEGWKDVDAFCNGKAKATGNNKTWKQTFLLTDFVYYPALYQDLVVLCIGTLDGPMHNATFETTVEGGSEQP